MESCRPFSSSVSYCHRWACNSECMPALVLVGGILQHWKAILDSTSRDKGQQGCWCCKGSLREAPDGPCVRSLRS